MDRTLVGYIVHGVAKSQTRLTTKQQQQPRHREASWLQAKHPTGKNEMTLFLQVSSISKLLKEK